MNYLSRRYMYVFLLDVRNIYLLFFGEIVMGCALLFNHFALLLSFSVLSESSTFQLRKQHHTRRPASIPLEKMLRCCQSIAKMYLAFFLNCTCGTQLSYTVFWKQIVLKAHQLLKKILFAILFYSKTALNIYLLHLENTRTNIYSAHGLI